MSQPASDFRCAGPPAPIEAYDLSHPMVPESLAGLTIMHLTDLHVTRPRANQRAFRNAVEAVARTPVDLVVLTGDYMTDPGNEPAALDTLRVLAEAWTARLGAFGVFGNHDSERFRRDCRSIDCVHWLGRECWEAPDAALRLAGAGYPEDFLETFLRAGVSPDGTDGRLTIGLAHHPTEIFPASELGIPILLVGHTHGGQVRLSARCSPHTSSDFPPNLATGVLRRRATLAGVSRGLGQALIDIRFNCPHQIPLYTLRHGPMPGAGGDQLTQVIPW